MDLSKLSADELRAKGLEAVDLATAIVAKGETEAEASKLADLQVVIDQTAKMLDLRDTAARLEKSGVTVAAPAAAGTDYTALVAAMRAEGTVATSKTLGEAITTHEAFGEWANKGGAGSDSFTLSTKDLYTNDAAPTLSRPGGYPVFQSRIAGDEKGEYLRLRVKDVLETLKTSTNLVEFVVEKSFTNNAANISEYASGDFVAAPKSAQDYELKQFPLRRSSHYETVSKNLLADQPAMQSWIENRLTYGLDFNSDNQYLNGSGTGQDLTGLFTVAGTRSVPYAAGDTYQKAEDRIRVGITATENTDMPAEFVIVSPLVWQNIELERGSTGYYVFGGPSAPSMKTLWGLPVVSSIHCPDAVALLGNRMAATIVDREEVEITLAPQHADFAIKGAVAIIAEKRETLAITRPKAFVVVHLS